MICDCTDFDLIAPILGGQIFYGVFQKYDLCWLCIDKKLPVRTQAMGEKIII
jgi:hypothetical protein